MEEENTNEQGLSPRERQLNALKPYQWKKGQSGNSLGRYVGGLSGKERMKRKIAGMTDDEFEEFIEGQTKTDLFKMAEGNPDNKLQGDKDAPFILRLTDINGNSIILNERSNITKELSSEELPENPTGSTPEI